MLMNNYNYNLNIEESYIFFSILKNLKNSIEKKHEIFSLKYSLKLIVPKNKINNIIFQLKEKYFIINNKKVFWFKKLYFKPEENNIYIQFNKNIFIFFDNNFIEFINSIKLKYTILSNLKIYELIYNKTTHKYNQNKLKTIDNSFLYIKKYKKTKKNINIKINKLNYILNTFDKIIIKNSIKNFNWNINKIKYINKKKLIDILKKRIEERKREVLFLNDLLIRIENNNKINNIDYYISLFKEAKKYFKNELNLKLIYKIELDKNLNKIIIAKIKKKKRKRAHKELNWKNNIVDKLKETIRKNEIYLFEKKKELIEI